MDLFLRFVFVGLVAILTSARQVGPAVPQSADATKARDVKLTVLSTMLVADPTRGVGEWGFAALLEVNGRRILIDTGPRPETVRRNAEEWGVDLSDVADVVLTHNHSDHAGGLVTLQRELGKRNPAALSRAHVAPGIFHVHVDTGGTDRNGLLPHRKQFEATGGRFVEHAKPTQLLPGVWFTGPVPRRHPERNWSTDLQLRTATGLVEDTIPEDASVVVDTDAGLIVITGCGHAGIVNIAEHARGFRPGLDGRQAAGVRNRPSPRCPLHGHRSGVSTPAGLQPHAADSSCRRRGSNLHAGQGYQPAAARALVPI
jgi:7,8-dihydropterin-6-yl-methyl-4-(beta-D-ribofuranosyl)aminobenzene 5'-phosphate synthase